MEIMTATPPLPRVSIPQICQVATVLTQRIHFTLRVRQSNIDGGPLWVHPCHASRSCKYRNGGYAVTIREKIRTASYGVITVVCGILAFILFRWTPTTGTGLIVFLALFAVVIILAMLLPSPRRGYWPHNPEDPGKSDKNGSA